MDAINYWKWISLGCVLLVPFVYSIRYEFAQFMASGIFLVVCWTLFWAPPRDSIPDPYPKTEVTQLADGCNLTKYWDGSGHLTKYVRCPKSETTTYTTKSCGKNCTREESITTKEEK